MNLSEKLCRRKFLQLSVATAITCGITTPAFALSKIAKGSKILDFRNLHTDEKLSIAYWRDGIYDRAALAKINHILRDHRSGDVYPMKLSLLDVLHDLQAKLNNHNTIEIISGYRSPRTNATMAKFGSGVANHSLHMEGKAIDIRLVGTPLPKLQRTALALGRGGVGYYPDSQFVHIDVGRVRRWQG